MFDPLRPEYLDAEACRTFKTTCKTLIHINGVLEIDLPESVDLFINHLPDVRIKGNTRCRNRIGFDYAPVPESFFRAAQSPTPTRLLCIIGGNETQNGPELLLDALAEFWGRIEPVDMIVSPHFPVSAKARLRNKRISADIHQNVESILPFLTEARSVICTYGNTTYEALSCHKPTFTVSYKSFQEEYSTYLESKGLVLNLGNFAKIDREKLELTMSDEWRSRLQHASRKAFKRSGIEQIADIIEEELDNVQDN
jgi:spore coat polysaccharide biosynthesis predicted glycosyltransferase SpsG